MRNGIGAAASLLSFSLLQACAANDAANDRALAQTYRHKQCEPIVQGRVVDQHGQPIAGATVVVVEEQSSPDRRRPTTETDGTYRLEFVNLGCPVPKSISVVVCARGFGPSKVTRQETDGAFSFEHALNAGPRETVVTTEDSQFQRECVRFARSARERPSTRIAALPRTPSPTTPAPATSPPRPVTPPTIAMPRTLSVEERNARRPAAEQKLAAATARLDELEQAGAPESERHDAELGVEFARLQLRALERGLDPDLGVPRKAFVGTHSSSPTINGYLARWASQVERVGTSHLLPDKPQGNVLVTTVIASDGSLRDARIERSSGNPALDRHALAILRLAAPFEPFPQGMRDLDELHISRTWRFVRE